MIKTEKAHLTIEAASHPGMTGKKNEDCYGVTAFLSGPKQQTASVLAVLCDGIGGHRAGEVAAEMGVSIITETVAADNPGQPLATLERAIARANQAIYQASQTDQGRSGMGATCACAWVIGNRLYTANLGDSRIYLLRAGHIVQLTTDHTWIQEALDAGIITAADREQHPNAHVIRRYLGSKEAPQPDFRLWFFEDEQDQDALDNQGLVLKLGDILLLCSDGLTDLVRDEEIRTILQSNPLAAVPDMLIEMANSRGGHDNTTVILMQTRQKDGGMLSAGKKRRWLIGCISVLMLVSAMIAAALLGLRWWGSRREALQTSQPEATLTLPVEVLETMVTPSVTMTSSPTSTIEPETEMLTPQSSITPWPTNTTAP